jgi:tetratricopeptide (TPR) repeat protein
MQIAERVYSLSQEQDDPRQMIWAYNALAGTLYFLGDFEESGQNARRGLQIWRSGIVQSDPEDVDTPVVSCLLTVSAIHRGWARSASGDLAEGISWIEQGIRDLRTTGALLGMPVFLARKAEALHLAGRTSEALEAISEAETVAERFEQRHFCAELHRLRGVFLAALGAEGTQIEASFSAAIKIAREQKSISLEKHAEENYAEYRRQKATESGGHGFRLG